MSMVKQLFSAFQLVMSIVTDCYAFMYTCSDRCICRWQTMWHCSGKQHCLLLKHISSEQGRTVVLIISKIRVIRHVFEAISEKKTFLNLHHYKLHLYWITVLPTSHVITITSKIKNSVFQTVLHFTRLQLTFCSALLFSNCVPLFHL